MSRGLSVIVPTYQRRDSVRRLLGALEKQQWPAERFEVIVVVDGSTDGTLEMLEALRTPFELIVQEQQNAGRAAACNAGLARARGEVVVFIDDDMEPLPGWLEAHARAHAASEPVGVVGPAPAARASTGIGAYLALKFEQHVARLERQGGAVQLRDIYTGNFSMRRDVLRELGGYDAGFTLYGNEDVELFARMRRAGVPVRFARDATALQHFAKDLSAVANDQVAKGRTAVLLARKHPDFASELKLATAAEASWPVRLVRGGALRIADIWKDFPHRAVRTVQVLERIAPRLAMRSYAPLLGYLYWVGARAALREAGPEGALAARAFAESRR